MFNLLVVDRNKDRANEAIALPRTEFERLVDELTDSTVLLERAIM